VTINAEFLLQIMLAIGAAGSVYAAIRSDLARLHERSNYAQEAITKAHSRIDEHLENHA
jgi:hypothetical protein